MRRRSRRSIEHDLSSPAAVSARSQLSMDQASEFIVASYNIHKAVGADRRRKPARTAAVIAEIGADILALQEADMRFGSRTGLMDLEALRRDLGLIAVPIESVGDAHGFHGNLLLVRNALVEVVHHLHLPGFEPRGALMADLTIAGQPLRVISAHLGLLLRSRARQTRALMDKLATLDDRPALLMGDLNEWRQGARSSLGPLSDRFAGSATAPSYPARYPLFALDRMMSCSQGELTDLVAHETPLSRIASDHLPVKARLRLTPNGTALSK
jgi:endonuclease/exonuclease/phosphatase family metal-dependent hydrolase